VISRITEGLSDTQVRVIRVRFLFLMTKVATDFLTAAGTAFTASVIEAKGTWPTVLALVVCLVGGLIVSAKNFGDALSAALPPPVIAAPPPTST
jgi:hypothetical protein